MLHMQYNKLTPSSVESKAEMHGNSCDGRRLHWLSEGHQQALASNVMPFLSHSMTSSNMMSS